MEKIDNNNFASEVAKALSTLKIPVKINGVINLFKDNFALCSGELEKNSPVGQAHFDQKLLDAVVNKKDGPAPIIYESIKSSDISEYLSTLKANMCEKNYNILYNNMRKKLRIFPLSNLFLQSFFIRENNAGVYYVKENIIFYDKKTKEKTLPHELTHAFTSYYDRKNNLFYSGFSRAFAVNVLGKDIGLYRIGAGLIEGYTQFFVNKYFPRKASTSYLEEQKIVGMLEYIIEPEKLENYYVSMNFPGLVNELKQGSSEKDTIKFIKNVDKLKGLYKKYDSKDTSDKEKEDIQKIVKILNNEIYATLVYWISAKKYKDYISGAITLEELRTIFNKLSYQTPHGTSLDSIFKVIYMNSEYSALNHDLIPNIYGLMNEEFRIPKKEEINAENEHRIKVT